jgi:hypothetical protein
LISLAKRNISIEINQDASSGALKYPYYESKHLASLGAKVSEFKQVKYHFQ